MTGYQSKKGMARDKLVQEAFNDWWDSDYDDSTNPYEKDTFAYWAWAGWQAALAQPAQEPVAWVDPKTLHHLKIGLEGVHLVYETEMVNSLPLYDKPQFQNPKQCLERLIRIMGTFDLATGHADTFDELLDSLESELRDVLGHYREALAQQPQRPWVGLTGNEWFEFWRVSQVADATEAEIDFADFLIIAQAVSAKLKEKNNAA